MLRFHSLGLPTRSHYDDAAFIGRSGAHVLVRLIDVVEGLAQVDDVDTVALGEDEALHLRVPAPGLMPEVDTTLQQLAHGHDGHDAPSWSLVVAAVRVDHRPGARSSARVALA